LFFDDEPEVLDLILEANELADEVVEDDARILEATELAVEMFEDDTVGLGGNGNRKAAS
jgi:hypothetical protein